MSRIHNIRETEAINNILSEIKENTIIYITTEDNGEMMFVCQRVGRGFTLYSNNNGHYSPTAENLEELKDMLCNDYIDGIIKDINIYNSDWSDKD